MQRNHRFCSIKCAAAEPCARRENESIANAKVVSRLCHSVHWTRPLLPVDNINTSFAIASPSFRIGLVELNDAIGVGTSVVLLVTERMVTEVAQDESAGSCI